MISKDNFILYGYNLFAGRGLFLVDIQCSNFSC